MEGRLLKGIFPKAESYLITNQPVEAKTQRHRIETGYSQGIGDVFVAHEPTFDKFVTTLKQKNLIICEQVTPLTGTPV